MLFRSRVTNPDGQFVTLANAFNVLLPAPALASVNPNVGVQGATLSGVVLTGSNLQSGASCEFGAGITVSSCVYTSATQLTANLSIASTAAVGPRAVKVTNPDGQFVTLANAFNVL